MKKLVSSNDFAEKNNIEDSGEARLTYCLALDGLRRQLEEERVLKLEELLWRRRNFL